MSPRPRDPSRDDVVIGATRALIATHGLGGVRMQDVAAAAGVSLATVYRRWPTRADLLVEALRQGRPTLPRLTGDVARDLRAVIAQIVGQLADAESRAVTGALGSLGDEPDIAAAVRDRSIAPMRAHLITCLRQDPTIGPADAELRTDAALGWIFVRQVVLDQEVTARDVRRLLGLVYQASG